MNVTTILDYSGIKAEHIVHRINRLIKYFPSVLAEQFVSEMKTAIHERRTFDDHIHRWGSLLSEVHLYYEKLLDEHRDSADAFIRHFFAGCCGYYNRHCMPKNLIQRDEVIVYFANEEYGRIFEQCCYEPGDEADCPNILNDRIFGDYVSAFRLMYTVFDCTLKTSFNADKHQRMASALMLFQMANSNILCGLDEFHTSRMTINPKERISAIENFSSYYAGLISGKPRFITDIPSFVKHIQYELEKTAKLLSGGCYILQRCPACDNYFLRAAEKGNFCSQDCEEYNSYWAKKYNKYASNSMQRWFNRNKTFRDTGVEEYKQYTYLQDYFQKMDCIKDLHERYREDGIPVAHYFFYNVVVYALLTWWNRTECPTFEGRLLLYRYLTGKDSLVKILGSDILKARKYRFSNKFDLEISERLFSNIKDTYQSELSKTKDLFERLIAFPM
jgi:hypothetical protein